MEARHQHFLLDNGRYANAQGVGNGAYGMVCKATDTKNGGDVAIKKIQCAFMGAQLARRALREVRILKQTNHENIVSLLDMYIAGEPEHSVYIVMTLMETDLDKIIRSTQTFTEQHHEYFMMQILRGLKYLHSVRIIHRDLKPSNILVNSNCNVKIADFGAARCVGERSEDLMMTMNVTTRWYRSPELLLSVQRYDAKLDLYMKDYAVDVWSAGCILAEMILRKPLFPGKDLATQVQMIARLRGAPEEKLLLMCPLEPMREWIRKSATRKATPWKKLIPAASKPQIKLIEKMLELMPWNRCTVEEALEMAFFANYKDLGTAPNAPRQVFVETEAIEHLEPHEIVQALISEANDYSISSLQ